MQKIKQTILPLIFLLGIFIFPKFVFAANINFTLEAWVKPTTSIATKAILVKNNEMRLVTDANGYLLCQIHNGVDWQTAASSSTTAPELNKWSQVGCNYDGANIRVYINGALKGAQAMTADVQNTTNKFFAGYDAGGTYGRFSGNIDEIAIYNDALSQQEFADHYSKGNLYKDENNNLKFEIGGLNLEADVSSWTANSWHMITTMWDPMGVNRTSESSQVYGALYIDGVSSATPSLSSFASPSSSPSSFYFAQDSLKNHNWDGTIQGLTFDESLWNENEIISAYNSGSGGNSIASARTNFMLSTASTTDVVSWSHSGNLAADGNMEDGDIAEWTGSASGYVSAESGSVRNENSLAGGWNFEDDLTDATGNNTLTGTNIAAADYVEGKFGKAINFDGSTEYLSQSVIDTQQGTMTASMADTAGFINDSGQDFSTYAGASGASKPYMIVLTDSTGKKAWGYVGEQGTGETLGGDIFSGWDFTSGWSIVSAGTVVSDSDTFIGTQVGGITKNIFTNRALYKGSFGGSTTAGELNVRSYLSPYPTLLLNGANNVYFNSFSTSVYIRNSTGPYTADITTLSAQQVLTPTANGVKIYSTKTGSTQSWAGVETGFNANSISSYEIRKTDFQITGALTVGAWVKTTSTAGKIFSKSYNYNTNHSFELYMTDSGIYRFSVSQDGVNYKIATNSAAQDTSQWHFITGVYDPSVSTKLYIDGVLSNVNTNAMYSSLLDNYEPLRIAKSNAGNFLDGLIDSPFISSRAYSADEIRKIYQQGWNDKFGAKLRFAADDAAAYLDESLTSGSDYLLSFDYRLGESNINPINFTAAGTLNYVPEANVMNTSLTGLVGAWNFEEGTGSSAADLSGNGNNGTITNATWSTSGKFGEAMSFDGDGDYVDIGDLNKWTTSITISIWIKISSAGADLVMFANDGTSILDSFGIDEGHIAYSKGGNTFMRETVDAFNDNNWHYVVLDTANNKIYVDGINKTLQNGSMYRLSTRVVIGARYNGGAYSYYFNGLIDSVRIYNRALTADEIYQQYKEGMKYTYSTSFESDLTGANLFKFIQNGATSGDSIVYVDNVNLMANSVDKGGFEGTFTDGIPAGWSATTDAFEAGEGVEETTERHTGAKSFELVDADDGEGIKQTITVASGSWYTLEIWSKNNNQDMEAVISGGATDTIDLTTAGNNWTKFSRTYKTSSTSITVQIQGGAADQDGFFDDVSLVVLGSSAATVASSNAAFTPNFGSQPGKVSGDYALNVTASDNLQFDEGALVAGVNYENFNPNQGSVKTWVKPYWDGSDVATHELYANGNTNYTRIYYSNGSLYFGIYDGSVLHQVSRSVSDWTAGNWYHIAASWSANNTVTASSTEYLMDLFVDGSNTGNSYSNVTSGINNWVAVAPGTLYIGQDSSAANQFNGLFSGLAIFNSPLSASEILTDYNSGSGSALSVETHCNASLPADPNDPDGMIRWHNKNYRQVTAGEYGLAAGYNFDEASSGSANGATLISVTGLYNGTGNWGANGSGLTYTTGKYSSALNFDGVDDYAEVAHNANIDIGAGSFTYECWVYITTSAGSWDMPIYKGGSNSSTPGYDMELGTSSWTAGISNGSAVFTQSFGTETLNQWVYLTAVVSRADNKLYVYKNGAVVGSGADISTLGTVDSSARNLRFGGTSSVFKGKLDSVRIYNRALSASEIKAHYNLGNLAHDGGMEEAAASGTVSQWSQSSEGSNLITNGNFSAWAIVGTFDNDPDGWTTVGEDVAGANKITQNPAGQCQLVSNGTLVQLYQSSILTIGKLYKYSIDIKTVTSGSISLRDGTVDFVTFNTTGIKTGYFTAQGTLFDIKRAAACDVTFDDVSVIEVQTASAESGTVADEDGLVGGWNFDGGTVGNSADGLTFTDVSGNSNTCTGNNGANDAGLTYENGKFGTALNYDGADDFEDCGDGDSLNFTGAFTLNFWFKLNTLPSAAEHSYYALGKGSFLGSAAFTSYSSGIYSVNDRLYFDISDGITRVSASGNKSDWQVGTWYNASFVWDGTIGSSAMKVYTDGALDKVSANNSVANLQTVGTHLRTGVSTTSSIAFNGLIDSPRIYDRALSASEIAAQYSLGRNKFDNYSAKIKLAADNSNSYLDESLTSGNDYLLSYWYKMGEDNINPINFTVSGAGAIAAEQNLMASSTTGLVGAWNFEEGGSSATTADLSGNGNTGTVTNAGGGTNATIAAMWTDGANGKYGRSLEFDGTDDYVTCGTGSSLDLTGALTLSAWAKTSSVQAYVIAKKDNNDAQYSIYIGSDNVLSFSYWDGVQNVAVPLSSSAVNDNTWKHLAITINGTSAKGYVNGVAGLSGDLDSSVTSFPLVPVTIGARKNGANPTYNLTGLIDSVRIYNRMLTASEIYDSYKAGMWRKYEFSFEADAGDASGNTLFKFIQNGTVSGNSIVYTDNFRIDKNLVDKGGIESFAGGDPNIPTGWSNSGLDGTEGVEGTDGFHTGAKSMKFVSADADEGITQTVTVESGKYYTFSIWAKNNNQNLNAVLSGGASATIDLTAANNNWTKFSGTYKPSSTSFTISILSGDTDQTGYFDDISLVELDNYTGATVATINTPSTATNSYGAGRWGESSGALLVDGADTLTYPTANNIYADEGMVAFWVKSALDYNKFGENKYLWTLDDGTNHVARIYYNYSDYKFYFEVYDGSNWTNVQAVSSAQSFTRNTWLHISANWNDRKNQTYLYVNGANDGSDTGYWYAQTLPTNMYFGSDYDGTNTGEMYFDDLRVYDHTLSAEDIKRLYGSASDPSASTLRVEIPFTSGGTGINGTGLYSLTGNFAAAFGYYPGKPTTEYGLGIFGSDNLQYGRGTQVDDIVYENFDGYQGTIKTWVKPAFDGTDATTNVILQNGDASNYTKLYYSSGSLYFDVYTSSTTYRAYKSVADWTTGTWYHIAAVWSNENAVTPGYIMDVYVNGSDSGATHSNDTAEVNSWAAFAPSSTTFVGQDKDAANQFNGIIGGLTIDNRPWSGDTILADYNSGSGTSSIVSSETRLALLGPNESTRSTNIIYWPIVESTGNLLSDGNMEDGDAAEWNDIGSSDVSAETTTKKFDAYSAKITISADDSNSYLDESLTSGNDYLLSYWYKMGEDNINPIMFTVSGAGAIAAEQNLMSTSATGLVGAWNFEEGSGTTATDVSGNGNNGTLTNMTDADWVDGKFGKALDFDGNTSNDDYVVKTSFSGVPSGPYTVSAWIKTNENNREQHIAEFQSTQFYITANNKIAIGTSSDKLPYSTSTISTGQWYFITAIYNSNSTGTIGHKIYINGILDASSDTSATFAPNSNFIIGDLYSHSSSYNFNGLIDSVRIYSRALTASEVYDNYKAGMWRKYEVAFEADQTGAHLFKFIQNGATAGNSIVYVDQADLVANLVDKGGFESFQGGDPNIPTGWINSGLDGTEGVEGTDGYHTGAKSMKFVSADADEGVTQTATVTSGNWYTFSIWAKNNNQNLNAVISGGASATIDLTTSNNSWTKFSGTYQPSSTSFTISILSGATDQTGYFDDISLVDLGASTAASVATPSSEANSYATGKWGSAGGDAFRVDGGDRLRYSASGVLPNDAGTISIWWKPMWDYDKFDQNVYILNSESASANLIRVFYDKTNHYYTAQLYNGTNWTTAVTNSAAQTFTEDTWQHIVVSFDNDVDTTNGSVVLYINGASSGTPYTSTKWTVQTVPDYFYAGSLFGATANSNQADGWLDDIRIYSGQISAANINAIYGINPNPPTSATWKKNLTTPIIGE